MQLIKITKKLKFINLIFFNFLNYNNHIIFLNKLKNKNKN